jgi:hypothetical protein
MFRLAMLKYSASVALLGSTAYIWRGSRNSSPRDLRAPTARTRTKHCVVMSAQRDREHLGHDLVDWAGAPDFMSAMLK